MRIMVVIGSVRPGRIGPTVADWVVRSISDRHPDAEVDLVDLADLALPFLDESAHPRMASYEQPHTLAWSARVTEADAVLLVAPEYNHSYSPALKNALDYLHREWWRKPVGIVCYGGVSAGTRGVDALTPVLVTLGMVKTGAGVEIGFAGGRIREAGGVFVPQGREDELLDHIVVEFRELGAALRPLQNR